MVSAVPFSTLISSCFLMVYITTTCADDTQVFPSFLPTHFDSSIDHLYNALDRISSWMTTNLLTLNSSKTEFLLTVTGLSKQLAKINNSSLNTTHSARNLGFIFDEHLTFSDHISSVSKSCYYHIRQLRCIRPYLDTKTASTIATSTPSLTTATLFITTCPSLRSPDSNRSSNYLARAVVKAPKFSHTTPILRSLHWLRLLSALNTSSSHLPTKFSQPPNLHICTTSS